MHRAKQEHGRSTVVGQESWEKRAEGGPGLVVEEAGIPLGPIKPYELVEV